mmetsp:Transcript_139113/g.432832  ORF Transcript_139113/g.432832 Transcript_139113/m.432832 type:complete len:217 (+) Transcript_139113:373-1023(+)
MPYQLRHLHACPEHARPVGHDGVQRVVAQHQEGAGRDRDDASPVPPAKPQGRLAQPLVAGAIDLQRALLVEAVVAADDAAEREVDAHGLHSRVEELLASGQGHLLNEAAELQHGHRVVVREVMQEWVPSEDWPVDLPVQHQLQVLRQDPEDCDVFSVHGLEGGESVGLQEVRNPGAELQGDVVLRHVAPDLLVGCDLLVSRHAQGGHARGDAADEG